MSGFIHSLSKPHHIINNGSSKNKILLVYPLPPSAITMGALNVYEHESSKTAYKFPNAQLQLHSLQFLFHHPL